MEKRKKGTRFLDVRPLDQRNKKIPYEIFGGKVHYLPQRLKINRSERFPLGFVFLILMALSSCVTILPVSKFQNTKNLPGKSARANKYPHFSDLNYEIGSSVKNCKVYEKNKKKRYHR